MKRQQFLQHRLQTLSALGDAVGAMRSLSAHHFRCARQALTAARQYRLEVGTVIAEIGIQQPLHVGAPTGLLVIASDLGLCSDYNAKVSQLAITEAKRYAAQTIYSVGCRARPALAKDALIPFRQYNAPASLDGLSQLLLWLAQDVLEDYVAGEIGSLHVVSAGFEGIGHFEPLSAQVLPIESVTGAAPLRRSPYVDSGHLTAVAIREFLYITLYEIFLDAMAAEQGMRLMATESALDWLENTTATTSRRLSSARSEAATQELLDIVAGRRQRLHAETS